MGEGLRFYNGKPLGIKRSVFWTIGGRKIDVGRLPLVGNGILREEQAAIFMAHRAKINPEGKPLKGLYVASAADFGGVLLSTDANEVIMVNDRWAGVLVTRHSRGINIRLLRQAMKRWGQPKPDNAKDVESALFWKKSTGVWHIQDFDNFAEEAIILELKGLGLESDQIKIGMSLYSPTLFSPNITIRFPWAYPGEQPRQRLFTFICTDITQYAGLRSWSLPDWLRPGAVDFCFQKAASNLMLKMDKYVPAIADAAGKFLLISPEKSRVDGEGPRMYIRSELASFLSPKFVLDDEVNDEFAKYFSPPLSSSTKTHPYYWYMQYWKRTGT